MHTQTAALFANANHRAICQTRSQLRARVGQRVLCPEMASDGLAEVRRRCQCHSFPAIEEQEFTYVGTAGAQWKSGKNVLRSMWANWVVNMREEATMLGSSTCKVLGTRRGLSTGLQGPKGKLRRANLHDGQKVYKAHTCCLWRAWHLRRTL